MAATVVVGGQYGSEGKGKLVSYLANRYNDVAVVRCGGPNAGHTADGELGRMTLRQLPSGAVTRHAQLLLAAGMQLDLEVLWQEIDALQLGPERLTVDRNAVIIESSDIARERELQLEDRLASTLSGTGSASSRKVVRSPDVRLAKDCAALEPFVGDVSEELATLRAAGTHIVVEGSQGAGLSLHHGPYPFVTGRDTTASSFLGEAGMPPTAASAVIVVLRTYPIRVAGNSGPLTEIGWEEVARRGGWPTPLAEFTSVTKRMRRVGEFDWALARRAIYLNGPTALALHGVDYLSHTDLGVQKFERLTDVSRAFIDRLESAFSVPVRYVFTGPGADDVIDRGVELEVGHAARFADRRDQ